MKTLTFEIELIEPMLGTLPKNEEIVAEHINSKHPEMVGEDEAGTLLTVDEDIENHTTGFPRDEEGRLFIWNYQVKGFLKDACLAIISSDDYKKEELKKYKLTEYLYKRTIDQQVFINPRRIYPEFFGGGEKITYCERPLRATTMRGERVALARSEEIAAGCKLVIRIEILKDNLEDWVRRWMDYGKYRGLGQWRNSGKGQFRYCEVKK